MWRDLMAMGIMASMAAVIALLAPPPEAQACGFVLPSPNQRALHVAQAEIALENGDLLMAGMALRDAGTHATKDQPLELRYNTVRAKIDVRRHSPDADEQHNPSRRYQPKRRALIRQQDLARASALLRAVADERHRTPRALTDLAEALALHPSHQREAKRILEDLATRDLVTSAHGWAALARLRHAAGDQDATRAALSRCQQMSTRPDRLCRTAPTPGELAPSPVEPGPPTST